ncbi:hypothetical protein SAY86_027191 [Trapa natans]|uniref:Exopolygalacturonase-like n=1 Tax=Trapa natans TaxID=22666 RepID=A0AAN7KTD9_TRANT|nr:hypothetical protein SAY86_027191 [Trapa natans]
MGGRRMKIIETTIVLLLSSSSIGDAQLFDVTKYGAKEDGVTSIHQALMKTWELACTSTSPSKIWIPKGKYALKEVKFSGPCKSHIELQLDGILIAPTDTGSFKTDGWISFENIDQFTLSGSGTFDGQGMHAWKFNDCHKRLKCNVLPMNLRFDFLTNAIIQGVTTLNSKNFHVNVLGCKNITFLDFNVITPEDSPNTDGIHIGRSDGVYITDSNIKTGDDCISLGDGSKNVHVTGVECGPGHGISIGSLGRYGNENPVSGVWVKNCTLTNTDNGLRIKTWPSSNRGIASNMHFEGIKMVNVGNPILIDQQYCPWNQCNTGISSLVQISNVSFKNIWGTSSTPVAVKLACSSKLPCKNVVIGGISLSYSGSTSETLSSKCSNVVPSFSGTQSPKVCST